MLSHTASFADNYNKKYHHRGLRERSEHWNPKNIGYSFLAEAKRLYEIDSELERPPRPPHGSTDRKYRQWEQRRLVTIQAALLLNTIHIFNGSDKIGWRYMRQAMDMARELQLFQTTTDDVGFELRAVRDRTAWALFIWQRYVTNTQSNERFNSYLRQRELLPQFPNPVGYIATRVSSPRPSCISPVVRRDLGEVSIERRAFAHSSRPHA